jgi:phosphatidylcholine synthase
MSTRRLAAWGVHLYTAVGAVVALLALDAIAAESYARAFWWMTAAFILDCTDGTLARRAHVKTVLPHFDGAKLDDIVDYLNYVLVPVALALQADLLPSGTAGVLVAALPLLASAYGFCNTSAKTPDHFFTGFPSYWNVVVFYFFALRAPIWFNAATLVFLSAAVFVPIRYLYPSRSSGVGLRMYVFGVVWGGLVFWLLFQFPTPSRALAVVSLFFPAYYVGQSLLVHFTTPPSPQPGDTVHEHAGS